MSRKLYFTSFSVRHVSSWFRAVILNCRNGSLRLLCLIFLMTCKTSFQTNETELRLKPMVLLLGYGRNYLRVQRVSGQGEMSISTNVFCLFVCLFVFLSSFFLSKNSEYGSVTLTTLGNQTLCFVTDSIVLQLFSNMALVSL